VESHDADARDEVVECGYPRRMNSTLRFASLATLICVSGCMGAQPRVTADTESVVYGSDDRTDVYAHPDPALQDLARQSIVALIPSENVDDFDPTDVVLYYDTLEDGFGVCPDQRFSQQPTAAECSGTLIADDLVVTVGHCVNTQSACRGYNFVFNYMYDADGVLRPITSDDVYSCAERVAYSERDDYAVVRLDRPVVGHTPAPIHPGHSVLAEGTPVTMIGFGVGLPAKIDDGGQVLLDVSSESYFIASVDAFGGNSGSGVFGADGQLLGMLSSGLDDFVPSPDGAECSVVYEVPTPSVERSEGENVIYAWAAMHALCRREPALSICGDPASWCPDCSNGGGGCSVSASGDTTGDGPCTLGLFGIAWVALVARRRR